MKGVDFGRVAADYATHRSEIPAVDCDRIFTLLRFSPLPPDAVARFDAVLAELLRARFPAEPLQVPHRVWALVMRRA